ncbi:MAG: T9SS type A sorting domain-containing protein [Bacteroidia bacterium]|nr:T9SS type A sorting domain-containing protein [Bacteroidia bacterium]
MRKSHIVAGITLLLIFATLLIFNRNLKTENSSSVEKEEYEERESGADKQLTLWFGARAYPDPYNLGDKYQRAWQQHLQLQNNSLSRTARVSAANWASVGTSVAGIGGRILCIAIDPNNSNNLWAGSASGGIWRSTNAGSSWTSVTTNLPVLGVTSILVDPSNSNVIYAGTGEVYRVDTSNIGFNVWKTRGTYGIGIIKSTNGGSTWTQVMTKTADQLFGIQMLKFDPTNSNTIYACATDGLYRSTNNGTSWSQILAKTYVSDVAINPSNTDQIVVGVGNLVNPDKGIYRTTNGSNASPTWGLISSGLPAANSIFGYIRFANSGSAILYASIGMDGSTTTSELYQSSNFGSTWSVKAGSNHASYQQWFAHDVAINPSNTDLLLICGVNWYRYTSSTSTRTNVAAAGHADVHDIVFDANVANRVYVTHDGGISVSNNGGANFSDINTGLNATQFYASLGVHPSNANLMIGGLQDNGVVRYNGTTWSTAFGGDGGPSAVAPNGTTVLASNDARSVRRSTTGVAGGFGSVLSSWAFVADDRTAFMAPVGISKSDGNYMYVASDNIHRSTNGGGAWSNTGTGSANYIEQQRKTAIALEVSPTNRDKIYVSTSNIAQNTTNDYLWINGQPNVFRTTTPATTPYPSIKGTLPDRFVMDFAISANNDDSVYVVLGGFGTSHVYLTPNGGTTWIDRGTGLPDVPFNAIVIDPTNPQVIYAGSDFGVYVSPDRGATWTDYSNGFWDATQVFDLQIDANNKLIAATHGKGIFRSDLYSGTLPVTITSFTGIHQSGLNKLEWRIENETGLRYYELERSIDGINFNLIATYPARNQSGSYVYTHTDPVSTTATAVYYYRLKSVDLDGSFTYSRVVSLQVNGKKAFNVLNNPFTDHVVVGINLLSNEKVTVNLYDAKARLVKKKVFNGTAGSNTFMLDNTETLSKGIYVLEAIVNKQKFSKQLLKN